tara:strand:- start:132 stop:737 length:606 start_codon:yes stop_codon:yes gene_type:complete
MINAWSLAGSILNGTFEKDYPIMDKTKGRWSEEDEIREMDDYKLREDDDGLDYEVDMSTIDDQYAHHFTNANSSYNDGWTQQFHQEQLEKLQKKMAHFFKYHEEEILKDIREYVSGTYKGHYTGNSHEYRKVQTIDLMASKDLAASFCQANILKYGSRYGNKDGKNKKDLMKVIHYAMLLLHFDGHYGEPSTPTNDFEQMP